MTAPGRMTGTYVITWPITDTAMPIAALKREALADLRDALEREGLTPTTEPTFAIQHGITPTEDGDWTHEKCAPPPDPLASGTICPTCWLTQPCDCEDQT